MAEFNGPATWRRSSRCDTMNCVEVAVAVDQESVLLRNSREPDLTVAVSRQAWREFRAALGAGELDTPEAGR